MLKWLSLLLYCTTSLAEPLNITLWHSLSGGLGKKLVQLTDEFNESQQEFHISPVYKGEYSNALTSFAAAFRAKQPPAIIQVYEVGSAIMSYPPGIVKPLDELLKETKVSLPIQDFLPAITANYSAQGRLQAMPFNVSVPVIFYNEKILATVGINEHNFPTTWQELEKVAKKLKQKGGRCIYTTAYPTWIHLESFSALHGLKMFENKQAIYNNPSINRHLNRLKRWQNKKYLQYGGRANDGTSLFTSGFCAMLSQSSGSYNSFNTSSTFPIKIAPMPLDELASQVRFNNVIGGAAFWTVSGLPEPMYQGIAQFYAYLAQPKVQSNWYKTTGYLPLGVKGVYQVDQNEPILSIAQLDLAAPQAPDELQAIPKNQIRQINVEAIEAIFSHIKTPEVALREATRKADLAIERFIRNTHSE